MNATVTTIMETVMMFGQEDKSSTPRCAKSAEDDRWYESCHGFFTLHHPCRRFLQVCADLHLFLHHEKIFFKSSSYIARSCRSAPRRLTLLIFDVKW